MAAIGTTGCNATGDKDSGIIRDEAGDTRPAVPTMPTRVL